MSTQKNSLRYILLFALITGLLVVVLSSRAINNNALYASVTQLDRPVTVAVIPLEYRGDRRYATVNVGEKVSALITNRLVDMGGNIRVVEREHLQSVLYEQDLVGRVDPSHAAEIGRLLGAEVLVFGTVTQFELSSTGGVRVRGIGVGGTRGRGGLTGRIVDSTTGVILGSLEGGGRATGTSIEVRDLEGVDFTASEFMESALGRATDEAINEVTQKLKVLIEQNADQITAVEAPQALSGKIIALIDGGVVIDIGEEDGVRRDQIFEVSRLQYVEGLADPVRIPAGEIRIVSVEQSAAVGMFERGGSDIAVGDVVSRE